MQIIMSMRLVTVTATETRYQTNYLEYQLKQRTQDLYHTLIVSIFMIPNAIEQTKNEPYTSRNEALEKERH